VPLYLVKFSMTPEAWAKLIKEPEDRRQTVGPLLEANGGKLLGLWYAFGDHDGYVLAEAPDTTTIASAGHRGGQWCVQLTVDHGAADGGGNPRGFAPGAEPRLPAAWRLTGALRELSRRSPDVRRPEGRSCLAGRSLTAVVPY
jgi:hypothetical protein